MLSRGHDKCFSISQGNISVQKINEMTMKLDLWTKPCIHRLIYVFLLPPSGATLEFTPIQLLEKEPIN